MYFLLLFNQPAVHPNKIDTPCKTKTGPGKVAPWREKSRSAKGGAAFG
jgi:hypothetical protein